MAGEALETKMAQPEIKRCPFCGAKARHGKGLKRKTDTLYQKAGEWMWKPFIGCKRCGIDIHFESVEAALQWWNTRTQAKQDLQSLKTKE